MAVTLISFAFFFGIAMSRVGLPPMVGFLVAGFAYNFMGFQAPDSLQAVADLGVTLLLFSIGLKLKIEDLATAEVWGTSVIHLICSTAFFTGTILVGQQLFDTAILDLSLFAIVVIAFGLSFSSRRRHTRSCLVSWARMCIRDSCNSSSELRSKNEQAMR